MTNDRQNTTDIQATQNQRNMNQANRPIANWSEVQSALDEVQKTFGFIPTFVENISDQALPGAWDEVKNLYFNPQTNLEPKLKHLIGLAIGAQIPCDMVNYFEQTWCRANGLSQEEQREAVMMTGITRHWSAVLNGSLLDKAMFQREADRVMGFAAEMMKTFKTQPPTEEMFQVRCTTASEAYQDIEKTLGLVPKFFQLFTDEGLPGAWSEFKGLQLNPFTTLSGKEKELIGLAVASQIPCEYCVYFHRSAAHLNGANDREIREAIAMAALTRHWSSIFHSGKTDLTTFKRDADRMIEGTGQNQLHS